MGRGRGTLTSPFQREKIIHLIEEACKAGARQEAACSLLGISSRTLQRWVKDENKQDGRLLKQGSPSNKLSKEEEEEVLKEINGPEYTDLSPHQIVPLLADLGKYM